MSEFETYRKNATDLRRKIIHALTAKKQAGIMHDSAIAQRADLEITAANISSMVDLLIRKGILTHQEVQEAILRGMTDELMRHENDLSDHLGHPVTID